ncbi:MAG: cytochrome c1 [Pseudomonadota bacterium]
MISVKGFVLASAAFAALAPLSAAQAAGGSHPLPDVEFAHEGVFGTFDRAQLQRGFQVYREICSGCHGLDHIAFRNLSGLGYTADEIKALAEEYEVEDGPNEDGEMFFRPALPSDRFPNPWLNEQEARVANNGAYPVNLALITDARAGGPQYVYSILTEYQDDPPDGVELRPGQYYTPAKGVIAMSPPLWGDDVEYADGTEATLEQSAKDVSAFLAWAAEPTMEARKSLGQKVMLFLAAFTLVFFIVKKKIWADVH